MVYLQKIGDCDSGIPIIIISGLDGSSGQVQPFLESLSAQKRAYLLNFENEENETLEELAKEMISVIIKSKIRRFDLMGQSIGSWLAALIAAELPKNTNKVILTCTFTRVKNRSLIIGNVILKYTPNFLYKILMPFFMSYYCGPIGDGKNHPFFFALKKSSKDKMVKRIRWQINRDFSADLEDITAPTLVLMGSKDRTLPNRDADIEHIKNITESKNNGYFKLIPECGHVILPTKAIDYTTIHILDFLK